jgi:pteridine reductase
MKIEGSVALVTGGAVRLGRAIALGLAEAGADVVITYNRSDGPAQETADLIRALGREAAVFQADFGRSQDMAGLVNEIVSDLGQLDVLVNNAAIFEPGEWDDTDEANWDRHFAINLKAPFFLTQSFAEVAKSGGYRGHVINIADWRGVRPGTDHVAYTLTKVGLIGMTKSMALALAPEIQVNAIAPGLILPPPGASDAFLARKAGEIPLAHHGSPAEIVSAVRYLLASDFVTGELIYVTGGEHL